MAAILDFTQFTFSAEEIRAVKELLWDEVIQAPEISLIHTVFDGIEYDKEIGFIGKGGMVGVAQQTGDGDPVAQAYAIATRKIKWEPKGWEILIHQKRVDIEATAAVYSMKTGTSYNDFTSSDYMAIILEALAISVKEFIIRLFWFNDTAADVIANGGTLTDGTDKKYFTILNGFWKQILAQTTANAAQKVAITENAGVSYAAQALTPANVRDTYLPGLLFGADMNLRGMANGFIICTQSFYDAYQKSLQSVAGGIEALYINLINGQKTLSYNGVPLLPIPIWDVIIKTYYNTGAKWLNPHRAVYTSKELLAVGSDAIKSFGDLDVWYHKDSRKVKIEGMGKADAKLLNPALFQVAI
jgi:hypothetical protein